MSVTESTTEKECTIYEVIRNTSLIQKMKLLFLQDIVINGKDICITRIVNKKKLIKILEEYREHYDDLIEYYDTITIYDLEEDSLLRAGLQKEVLRFMIPYIDANSGGEFGKIVYKNKEYIYNVQTWI